MSKKNSVRIISPEDVRLAALFLRIGHAGTRFSADATNEQLCQEILRRLSKNPLRP